MKPNPRNRLHLGALGTIGLLAFSANGQAASRYTSGHGDISFGYTGLNEPYNHFQAEGAVVEGTVRPSEDFGSRPISILVPATSSTTTGSGADFLGISSTATYWKLEQTENAAAEDSAPFLGLSTEELVTADWTNVQFSLTSFSGAGDFAFYRLGDVVPIWDTVDGVVSGADDHYDWSRVGSGADEHGNYAFSAPGIYNLRITMSGIHTTDGAQSVSKTYVFAVVPEPSAVVLGAISILAFTTRRNRLNGFSV